MINNIIQYIATSDMHRQGQPDNLVVYCKFSVKYHTIKLVKSILFNIIV